MRIGTMVANLERVLTYATTAEIREGLRWYPEATELADSITRRLHGQVSFEQVAGVLAVTSPRVEWALQVAKTETYIRHLLDGGDYRTGGMPGTYSNKLKAYRIINGENVLMNLGKKAPKVRAFYANITGDGRLVTLDRHAIDALVGRRLSDRERDAKSTDEKWRTNAVKAYLKFAARHGWRPADAQAVIWVVWRNLATDSRGRVIGRQHTLAEI